MFFCELINLFLKMFTPLGRHIATWMEVHDDARLPAKLTNFWTVFSPLLVVASLLPFPVQASFLVAGLFAVEVSGGPLKDDLKERMPTEAMNRLLSRAC